MIDINYPISLYIHIPFCTRKCSYCAFYSLPSTSWPLSPDYYGDFIIEEIEKLNDLSFETIYIGGGNPALLSDDKILEIIKTAEKGKKAKEVTIEMNPEEVSEKRISKLSGSVTRFSIGIQSLNPRTLKMLGRNSSRDENIKALSIFKESSLNYNADLITAAPDTTLSENLNDIKELSSYDPFHISYYCLSYEEGTKMYKKRKMRDEKNEIDALLNGWRLLKDLGYEHYEVSNFAKDRHYSLHNLNYWRLGEYIGLGAAAESSVGLSRIYSNHFDEDIEKYISNPAFNWEELTNNEAILEYIMVALRTKWGINKKDVLERFNVDFDSLFSLKNINAEYYNNTKDSFSLNEKGLMVLDSIILSLALSL